MKKAMTKKNPGKAHSPQPNRAGKNAKTPKASSTGPVGPKISKYKAPKNVAPPKKVTSIAQLTAFRKAKYGL